jgi:hypothetical protein
LCGLWPVIFTIHFYRMELAGYENIGLLFF